MRAEGEQLSSLPRHSGQRTIRRGLPKSRSENPPGDLSAAKDPFAECGEGLVTSSRYDNLPRSLSIASSNEVWKVEGVSTFSLGVLVPGRWYPHHPPVLVVIELGSCRRRQ